MIRVGLALLAAAFVLPVPSYGETPREILKQIRSAKLDPAGAVAVERLEIDLDLGFLELDEGVLIPAVPLSGRVREAVFLGSGRIRVEPPDAIEAGQLELFTDQESLDLAIDSAVIVVGDPSVASALFERDAAPLDEERRTEAEELFDTWVSGPVRKGFGADAAILKSALGDSAYQRYFSVVLHSEEKGSFYYLLDPSELEQVTLGQFVPFEFDDRDEYRAERAIRKEKRRGRSLQTRIEDLGDWNTWLQSSLRDAAGQPLPGSAGFEPEHYSLDATLTPRDQRIETRAKIDIVAEVAGRRALTLELFADLEPSAVRDGQGSELFWFRSGSDLHVALAEPVAAQEKFRLEIDYAGVLLEELEKGIFRLRDTFSWYPHVGTVDRATYEAELQYPKRVELLASGRIVDSRVEEGVVVEKRRLDVPVLGFSFEIGQFEIVQERVGHVDLTVGFSKSTLVKDTGVKPEVLETLKNALQFYEEQYGAYPVDHLTVATVPRGFSQGFLSFVTLSHYLVAAPRYAWVVVGEDFGSREEKRTHTIAHELAHQWWGNKVGWYSDRDQWLSEALADFAAVRYVATQADRKTVYLARHGRRWQYSLRDETSDGRTLESLGPVVLGQRLFSSYSRRAYSAVVYDKGAVVFGMLSRALGEEPFTQMLKVLADAVGNRAIDTATFLKSIERMSGLNLESFTDHFIYGTGIPEVYYRFTFSKRDDGQWRVEGDARQVATANYRYTLEKMESGGWDVFSERVDSVEVVDSVLIVPFQVILEDAESSEKKGSRYETGRGLGGTLVLEGELTEFSFAIPERPRDFFLDQQGEVLAMFYCESRQPKRMLRYRAMELTGKEAEATYKEALAASFLSEQALGAGELSDKQLKLLTDLEDARIQLDLARLYLDRGAVQEAQNALDTADGMIGHFHKYRFEGTRAILESRMAIRRGDFKAAYKTLSGHLRLHFPRMDTDTLSSDVRRSRWSSGRTGDGEDYAVLAVAAFHTGHEVVARRALDEAEKRGADMTPLQELLPES